MSVFEKRRERKRQLYELLGHKLGESKKMVIVGLEGVETPVTQRVRVELRGKAEIKVVKNTVLSKALDASNLDQNVKEEVKKALKGANAVVFSNVGVFDVASVLNSHKVHTYLKPGRITPVDVVVPAGVTTLQPGPLTESLTAFGVPFEVKKNLVYISKDTLVARAGERVNARLCELLRALSITPTESGFALKVGLDDGLLVSSNILQTDLGEYRSQAMRAIADAFSLSYNSALPVPEVAPLLVERAAREALSAAVEAGYVTAETAQPILAKAYAAAQYIASTFLKESSG
ncbi:MAG: 50S ribosomal protein L10 [Thermoprotei archaeon]